MADRASSILGLNGKPMTVPGKSILTSEIAGPTLAGVRSPLTGYPANGLTPQRLAEILREADEGQPLRYLELAEQIEERDLHFAGIMSTRKRSVSQLDISVEAGSDAPEHEAHADQIRQWLKRDELTEELFDVLDAIGKGYSLTEIIWDISEKQYQPARLERRDPRWFRFERANGMTPLLLDDGGQETNLPDYKFIYTVMRAKSGLPIRSGLSRIAAWAWMFKAYTQRDWTIFTQTYGQPIRLGKYHRGATDKEKETLYQAVANIAGDCAAIIPDTMMIEFVKADAVNATGELYRNRVNWLDQQMSKAVLGQTATTDAIAGGHAVGQEHRQVQEDIERADAKALASNLNRDLIRPWIDLDHGPQTAYPRLKIGRPDEEDTSALVKNVATLVPFGLRVKQAEMRERLNLSEPDPDDELLQSAPPTAQVAANPATTAPGLPNPAAPAETHAAQTIPGQTIPGEDTIALSGAAGAMDEIDAQVKQAVATATSLEELRANLNALKISVSTDKLAAAVRQALLVSDLAGRAEMGNG